MPASRSTTGARLLIGTLVAALLLVGSWSGVPAGAQTAPTQPGSLGPSHTHAYVQAVHQLFLGRAATSAEAGSLAHLVHRDGPVALTTRLAVSPEWAGLRIDDLYRRILRRAPDAGGRSHYLDQLAMGRTLEAVAAEMLGSDEYYGLVGRQPEPFVDSLYELVLGRQPDDGGRSTWLDALRRGMTRTQVADAFYRSLESRRQRVDRLYLEVLRRAADAGGRVFWVERIATLGDVGVASRLAASNELHRRVTGAPLPDVRVSLVGAGTAHPLTHSWRSGCPVGPRDLRAVAFPHHRPDGTTTRGVLIVHHDAVPDVTTLVRAAWGGRFPITQARPVDDFGGDDDASMAADNSSAFNCRDVAGTTIWSQHTYGRAVDFNPVRNPSVRGTTVEPPAGAAYTDRSDVRPGMLVEGGTVIDAVDRIGWGWGGRWSPSADHQHVSRNGR